MTCVIYEKKMVCWTSYILIDVALLQNKVSNDLSHTHKQGVEVGMKPLLKTKKGF